MLPAMLALGIDVSLRRGLDAVLLNDNLQILETRRRLETRHVLEFARRTRPSVICINSPPAWARSGRSRSTEQRLARLGISAFATPIDSGDHPFYTWMKAGFKVFTALQDDYPLYRGGALEGKAAEVFPHASAVVLTGRLRGDETKRALRLSALRNAGIDTTGLRTQDLIDAALAAFTGILALQGRFTPIGDPADGCLLLPAAGLPPRYTRH